MSSDRKRSMVWNFYHFTRNKEYVMCKICRKEYKYFKNTTNLKGHLERLHPGYLMMRPIKQNDFFEEESPNGLLEKPQNGATAETIMVLTTVGSNSTNGSLQIPQAPITPSKGVKNINKMHLLESASDNALLTETQISDFNLALVKMIVLDYQPLRIIEDGGFQDFVKALNPLYSLPTRKNLTAQLIPTYYLSEVEKLKQRLSFVDHVGVTTDLWTSDNTNHYVTVSVHFVENSKLHASTLQTKKVKGNRTGSVLAAELVDIFNNWHIKNKIVSVVSDNDANIKAAITDHLRIHHHPCLVHTLNISVNDGLNKNNNLKAILEKCRQIVGHIKCSAIAMKKLNKIQQKINTRELNVKQDVDTFWNSTYLMLQRMIDIKDSIMAAMLNLPDVPKPLTANEWMTIEDCVSLLKPFDLMVTVLSGEEYITSSSIIPLVRGMQFSAEKVNCVTDIGKWLKNNLLMIISRRLGSYERDKISAKATFLDPRYKKQAFGLQENAINAEKWVLEELESLFDKVSSPSQEVPTTVKAKTLAETDPGNMADDDMLWEYFDKKVADSNNFTSSPTTKAILMVKQYLSIPNIPRSSSPFAFWTENKYLLPELFRLQQKYLCAPATSVPSDRLFSKTGIINNLRRNRLPARYVDQIIFLNSNL